MKTILVMSVLVGASMAFAQTRDQQKNLVLPQKNRTVVVSDKNVTTLSPQKSNVTTVQKSSPATQLPRAMSALGSEGVGGGNAIGDQLFDFAEIPLEQTKINVKNLPAYQQVLSILKSVKRKIPGLAIDLEKVAESKTWYMIDHKLSQDNCRDASVVSYQTVVVACQIDDSIYIDKAWYLRVTEANQIGLLLHEMVRGLVESNTETKTLSHFAREQGIRTLTRALCFQSEISSDDLQKILEQLNFVLEKTPLYLIGEADSSYRTVDQILERNKGNVLATQLYNDMIRKNFVPQKQYFDANCQIASQELEKLRSNVGEALHYQAEAGWGLYAYVCADSEDCFTKLFHLIPQASTQTVTQVPNCAEAQKALDLLNSKPRVVTR